VHKWTKLGLTEHSAQKWTELGLAEQCIKNGLNWGWLNTVHKEWTELGLAEHSA
jgi:hypothetical protein